MALIVARQCTRGIGAVSEYYCDSLIRPQRRQFSVAELATGDLSEQLAIPGAALLSSLSIGYWLTSRYKVSKPDEMLVRTGPFIKDVSVTKQGILWPFQRFRFISLAPTTYSFDLHAMSSEKMEFILPGVFTIGPKYDDIQALERFARLMCQDSASAAPSILPDQASQLVKGIVLGIVEGETRQQSAQMQIEDIFSDRKKFQSMIVEQIQDELFKFGLVVYNANIKELQDSEGSEYFMFMRKKKRSESENIARVDVATAEKRGAIGQKEREAETRTSVIDLEANTVEKENLRRQDIEKSTAALAEVTAEARRRRELSALEATMATKLREAELQRQFEERRIMVETERLRASDMSRSRVAAETTIVEAEGNARSKNIEADAFLYTKQREADGIRAIYQAQSEGINNLIQSFGGDSAALAQYLMIERGIYENLAKTNAEAIRGLNPKITVWNTSNGGSSDDPMDFAKPVANVLKMIPPLLSAVQDQTGVNPLSRLVEPNPPSTATRQ